MFDTITGVFTILGPSGIYTVPGFQRGAKIVGVVVPNAAGDFSFHLPAGIKNSSYTMEARALSPSGSSYKLSVPLAFKAGPAPHIKPASKSPAEPKSTKPVKAVTSKRKVVKVQPRAVQADQTVTISKFERLPD